MKNVQCYLAQIVDNKIISLKIVDGAGKVGKLVNALANDLFPLEPDRYKEISGALLEDGIYKLDGWSLQWGILEGNEIKNN